MLYTIGFTKKSAEDFFELLKKNNISTLIDIRLKNNSQLAGFAKGNDLKYFCKEILGIDYKHDIRFSPTEELLDSYKKGLCEWDDFEIKFNKLMDERDIRNVIESEYKDKIEGACLLCSELKADHCHRKLVAEYFQKSISDVNVEIAHI